MESETRLTDRTPDDEFREGLLELVPFLRAFARTLCGQRELADDLAQETLTKAWQARATFQAGTKLKAWLFTILRNEFYSNRRRAWRQAPWDETAAENIPSAGGEQTWAVQLSETVRMLRHLPAEQREALILVGAGGFSYEDTAKIVNCAVGTVKSRVARARKALIAAMDGDGSLGSTSGPVEGNAANEIMAQLDRLTPPGTTAGSDAVKTPGGKRDDS